MVHGQEGEINQCPYIGGQHLPDNMGVSICVRPEGHKFMSHCGRCPLVEVTKAARSQSKISQYPFIGYI